MDSVTIIRIVSGVLFAVVLGSSGGALIGSAGPTSQSWQQPDHAAQPGA